LYTALLIIYSLLYWDTYYIPSLILRYLLSTLSYTEVLILCSLSCWGTNYILSLILRYLLYTLSYTEILIIYLLLYWGTYYLLCLILRYLLYTLFYTEVLITYSILYWDTNDILFYTEVLIIYSLLYRLPETCWEVVSHSDWQTWRSCQIKKYFASPKKKPKKFTVMCIMFNLAFLECFTLVLAISPLVFIEVKVIQFLSVVQNCICYVFYSVCLEFWWPCTIGQWLYERHIYIYK
jgi:hypothetical protein